MKARARQIELRVNAFVREILVPTLHCSLAILDVLAAQNFVERVTQGHFARHELSIFDDHQSETPACGDVLVVLLLLFVASLEASREEVCAVGTDLAAEEV